MPKGDPFFDFGGTGRVVIALNRSDWKKGTGTSRLNPRQQMNAITTWIDASSVYGSDEERADALRGRKGKLKTSRGKLLPRNSQGLPNAGGPRPDLFLAGDVRANEQVALTAMHTLWVREHNRIAKRVRRDHPGMSADEVLRDRSSQSRRFDSGDHLQRVSPRAARSRRSRSLQDIPQ